MEEKKTTAKNFIAENFVVIAGFTIYAVGVTVGILATREQYKDCIKLDKILKEYSPCKGTKLADEIYRLAKTSTNVTPSKPCEICGSVTFRDLHQLAEEYICNAAAAGKLDNTIEGILIFNKKQ